MRECVERGRYGKYAEEERQIMIRMRGKAEAIIRYVKIRTTA